MESQPVHFTIREGGSWLVDLAITDSTANGP